MDSTLFVIVLWTTVLCFNICYKTLNYNLIMTYISTKRNKGYRLYNGKSSWKYIERYDYFCSCVPLPLKFFFRLLLLSMYVWYNTFSVPVIIIWEESRNTNRWRYSISLVEYRVTLIPSYFGCKVVGRFLFCVCLWPTFIIFTFL